MLTFVVTKKMKKLCVLSFISLLVLCVGIKAYPALMRTLYAVKSGVTVDGVDFSRLNRKEALAKLITMSENISRAPQDAYYYPESGEVIAEHYGIVADVEGTLNEVMNAKAGEMVSFVVSTTSPSITKEMAKAVYFVDTKERAIALCINVAWGEEYLLGILEELERRHLNATFFITGTWGKQFPDLLKRIADGGHELANHGYSHPHVMNMSEEDLRELITTNEKLIFEATGKTTRLFAPPYGEVSDRISSIVAKCGYRTIMWTIDTIDWQRPQASVIVDRVINKLQPGAIVLAHPTEPTRKALPTILDELIANEYRLMTVSQLLSLEKKQ